MRTALGVIHETRFVYNGNQIVLQFDESGGGAMTGANLTIVISGVRRWINSCRQQVTSVSQPGTLVLPLTDNVGTVS